MMPGLAGFIAAAQGGAVQLFDFTDVEEVVPPSDAATFYQLQGDGNINVSDGFSNMSLGTWLLAGSPGDYEAKMTLTSGVLTTGESGVWGTPLQMWGVVRTTFGTSQAVGVLQLRRKADGAILATANISLTSTKTPSV